MGSKFRGRYLQIVPTGGCCAPFSLVQAIVVAISLKLTPPVNFLLAFYVLSCKWT